MRPAARNQGIGHIFALERPIDLYQYSELVFGNGRKDNSLGTQALSPLLRLNTPSAVHDTNKFVTDRHIHPWFFVDAATTMAICELWRAPGKERSIRVPLNFFRDIFELDEVCE